MTRGHIKYLLALCVVTQGDKVLSNQRNKQTNIVKFGKCCPTLIGDCVCVRVLQNRGWGEGLRGCQGHLRSHTHTTDFHRKPWNYSLFSLKNAAHGSVPIFLYFPLLLFPTSPLSRQPFLLPLFTPCFQVNCLAPFSPPLPPPPPPPPTPPTPPPLPPLPPPRMPVLLRKRSSAWLCVRRIQSNVGVYSWQLDWFIQQMT